MYNMLQLTETALIFFILKLTSLQEKFLIYNNTAFTVQGYLFFFPDIK